MNEHFYNGFIKRAQQYGLTAIEATNLAKTADTSWLGRYLAAGQVPRSTMNNKVKILEDLDPTGELQNQRLILSSDELKKQRELAYDYMRKHLDRSTAGGYGANIALGALLGAFGGGIGGLQAAGPNPVALAGVGAGALLGGGLGALGHAMGKYTKNKITDEDIARMKAEQKDRSFVSDFMPFRDVLDATRAGGARHDK
jgi:hypothetical protein